MKGRNYLQIKGYYPKYINSSNNSTSKNNYVKRWTGDLSRHFSKGVMQMAKGHMFDLIILQGNVNQNVQPNGGITSNLSERLS